MKLHPIQRLLSLAELTVAPHVRRQVEASSATPVLSGAAFSVYAQSSDAVVATLHLSALEWLVCHTRFPGIARDPRVGSFAGVGTVVLPRDKEFKRTGRIVHLFANPAYCGTQLYLWVRDESDENVKAMMT